MDSKKPIYKSKIFWVLFLFLLYSALGFFAVPYFIKKNLTEIVINDLNSSLIIDDISFNPYTISTDITNIKITDNDSTLWFSSDKIHANINLTDTIINHLSLSKVHVTNPFYLLSLDATQLIQYPRLNDSTESEEDSDFLISVEAIDIDKGSIQLNNQTDVKKLDINIKQIIFHHDAFTTLNQDSIFDLSFITDNNDKTTLKGSINLPKSSFDVQWTADNWTTETLFNVLGNQQDKLFGFKNKSGTIKANGNIKYLGETDKLPEVSMASFKLSDFKNETSDNKQLSYSVPLLEVNNTVIDLNNQSISIENVITEAVDLSVSFDKNNILIFNNIDNTQAPENEQNNEWIYTINTINTNNSVLNLNKVKNNNLNSNVLAFELIKITNLTNLENQITNIVLNSKIDSEGLVEINSKLELKPFELTNSITVVGINLSKWQAWVPDDIKLEIASGLLESEQELIYKDNNIISNGWFKFNDIELKDQNKQPFFSVNQLDLKQTTIDSLSETISISSIVLDSAQGEIIVSEDQQLNINNIVPTTASDQMPIEENEWIIDIKEIELIDAQTSLTDKSIKPNYQTELSKINGKVKGLSSNNLSKADVNLSGLLDTYGKLKIDGQINPLSDIAYTDISINIENLDLQNFSSYSSQFLGFPITRGKVDFDLNYKLNENLLKGINKLTFKQLKFGDKTPSKDAINLPLKLAVGLLTDGKGIMKINLPVSGNVNDPEFSYGGIVFKAFFKLITGIVASPFKLLGKLIPGGADLDLSGIQFQAGTIELQQQEQAKLEAMKKILKQRPGILLELSGVVNTINDARALQLLQLLTLLNLPEKPVFASDYSIQSLKTLYISTFGDESWQQLIANATKDEILNNEILANNTWDALLQHQNTDGKLTILAKDRAQYIQSQLIENYSVSEDKIFIKPNEMSEELYPQVKFGVGQ